MFATVCSSSRDRYIVIVTLAAESFFDLKTPFLKTVPSLACLSTSTPTCNSKQPQATVSSGKQQYVTVNQQ